jgi:hypothetical protein
MAGQLQVTLLVKHEVQFVSEMIVLYAAANRKNTCVRYIECDAYLHACIVIEQQPVPEKLVDFSNCQSCTLPCPPGTLHAIAPCLMQSLRGNQKLTLFQMMNHRSNEENIHNFNKIQGGSSNNAVCKQRVLNHSTSLGRAVPRIHTFA